MMEDNERPVRSFFVHVLGDLSNWGFILLAVVFVGVGWLFVSAGYVYRSGIGLLMVPLGTACWVAALTCLFIIIPERHDPVWRRGR
jgi:hypothetical protein